MWKAAFCLVMVLCCGSVLAEQRLALVIGNSNYKDSPLPNPVHDATDMANTLRELQFEVIALTDADRQTMREAIRDFGEKLKKGGVGLFYYAGHGVQVKGQNYLVPVNADITSADEVEDESIDADSVLRKMETAGNDVNIIILDACRNNPFPRDSRSMGEGLAKMEGPKGSIIAFATAPGSTAADGSGDNGLYTSHLLQAIKTPGLSIEEVFKQVRVGVLKDTEGQQIPWESSSLTGNFEFLGAPAATAAAPSAASATAVSAPPPPPQILSTLGMLQVTANVAGGKVFVDGMDRGVLPGSHALNLQDLSGESVEVRIEMPGYKAEPQHVKLQPGIWQQAYFELIPETAPANTAASQPGTTPPAVAPAQAQPPAQSASAASGSKSAAATEFDFGALMKSSSSLETSDKQRSAKAKPGKATPEKNQMPIFTTEPGR